MAEGSKKPVSKDTGFSMLFDHYASKSASVAASVAGAVVAGAVVSGALEPPQATRPRTMTTASRRAISFFIIIFLLREFYFISPKQESIASPLTNLNLLENILKI